MIEQVAFPKPKVHLFVCINDRQETTGMPSCGPRMTKAQVKEIKQWIQQQGLTTHVYCTSVKCLGFCNPEKSICCVYPSGRFFKIDGVEDCKKIVMDEMKKTEEKN